MKQKRISQIPALRGSEIEDAIRTSISVKSVKEMRKDITTSLVVLSDDLVKEVTSANTSAFLGEEIENQSQTYEIAQKKERTSHKELHPKHMHDRSEEV